MNNFAITTLISLSLVALLTGCAKTEKTATAQTDKTNAQPPRADIILNDNGKIDDKSLAEAQHINIAIDGQGMVTIQNVPDKDGKIKDHRLSDKDSKALLAAILKVNKGGDKQELTDMIQNHITRIQTEL